MEFQDKVLKCVDCGGDFVFTAGEQLFFHDKQFKNEPKRCKNCKSKRASNVGPTPSGNYNNRVETRTSCSGCGKETTVPFKPTQGRPVSVASASSRSGQRHRPKSLPIESLILRVTEEAIHFCAKPGPYWSSILSSST